MTALEILLSRISVEGMNKAALAEIIRATGKPDIAVQKLFNEYSEPNVKLAQHSRQRVPCTFSKYNPWTETVEYNYQVRASVEERYFDSPEEAEAAKGPEEGKPYYEVPSGKRSDMVKKTFFSDKLKLAKSTCNLTSWNEGSFNQHMPDGMKSYYEKEETRMQA